MSALFLSFSSKHNIAIVNLIGRYMADYPERAPLLRAVSPAFLTHIGIRRFLRSIGFCSGTSSRPSTNFRAAASFSHSGIGRTGACSISIAAARSSALSSISWFRIRIRSCRKLAIRFIRRSLTSPSWPLFSVSMYWTNRRSRSSAVFGLMTVPRDPDLSHRAISPGTYRGVYLPHELLHAGAPIRLGCQAQFVLQKIRPITAAGHVCL
jgi:hypothetical protein